MIHFHRYTWGEPFEMEMEIYSHLGISPGQYSVPQFKNVIQTFQDGTCSKCGLVTRRRVH